MYHSESCVHLVGRSVDVSKIIFDFKVFDDGQANAISLDGAFNIRISSDASAVPSEASEVLLNGVVGSWQMFNPVCSVNL